MSVVGVIQARMGSTRLPGKVMLPLDGAHVIEHDIRRAQATQAVDEVVVATTFHPQDDIVARYAARAGASVYRGSEDDVLGRIHGAATAHDADVVVRLTGDNPFVEPRLISEVATRVAERDLDYASNKVERTWPLGVDAEAFTFESFDRVEREATEAHQREHVTPYYHEQGDFDRENVTIEDVYREHPFEAGPELRLTLDEPSDYEVYRDIYESVDYDEILDVRDAVAYAVENDLGEANAEVNQKTMW
jgi:spore coat polysaccharide biosynthesis protein SpsF